ncbi:serine/threonine-protein kinase [Actinomadura rudentiformis]|uniref:serine/threonine-protein kinase n=1 Tax=Actinomadura rudentiformis TaxID=359158 RepID=UPI00178C7116|nr:serine/threonine-protein kinase [Actinomadura rudentiformis]
MPEADPLRPEDPQAVGPYPLSGRLGMGGQGVVYLGTGPDGTPVAVKLLREELAADPRVRERFMKEIAAARRVDPFCIAQVLDASLDGPRPYIVTEYVEGPSLQQAGPRPNAASLQRLAVATATALAAIHQAGIVHRDFKPSNVLLAPDGPRVIDFGIARASEAPLTMTSSIIGTPAYMAPEQFEGKAIGPPADVFAWGVVMVFSATGEPAFGADTLPAVMKRVMSDTADLSRLPEPLRATVADCLAKDPAQRPTMQDVLLRLLGSAQQTAPIPPVATPAPPLSDATVIDGPRSPAAAAAAAATAAPRPAAAPLPASTPRRQRSQGRPALILGIGGAGVLLAAAAAVILVITQLTGDSGPKGTESAGANGVSKNGTQQDGDGANSADGTGQTPGKGTEKASPGAGTTPKAGGGRTNPSKSPGTGGGSRGGGGSGGGGTEGGTGGDSGGGGDSGSQPPPPPGARISYFRVGNSGCNRKGYPMDFNYSIVADKNPTKIEFAIYFNGRLGVGHPIDATADPAFTISNARTEDEAGTYTYRMVLLKPARAEISRTVKVC